MNKIFFTDSHIHISDLSSNKILKDSYVCSSCHSVTDFNFVKKISENNPDNIFISFGIHPQNPDLSLVTYLEKLLKSDKIVAIGECGFDLFSKDFASMLNFQKESWEIQLEFAEKYCKPIVIHSRKALDKIFSYSKTLAKLPAVIFHSFPGSIIEAESFLKRGINAYFSIGKQVLNGNKKVIQCAQNLPLTKILTETDAPFQTLKYEKETFPIDIIRVYNEIASLRSISIEKMAEQIKQNFMQCFIK